MQSKSEPKNVCYIHLFLYLFITDVQNIQWLSNVIGENTKDARKIRPATLTLTLEAL